MAIRQGGRLWIARAAIAAGGFAGIVFVLLNGNIDPALVCAGVAPSIGGQTATFTRSSSKYCTKADGTMILLGNNLPAIEPNGFYIEAGGTNLILRSEALDNATWTKNTVTSAAPVVTADAAVAPNLATTADQLAFPLVSVAGSVSTISQQFSASNASWSGSIYLKGSATTTVYLGFCRASAGVCNGTNYLGTVTCQVTTAWSRCVTRNVTLTAVATVLQLGVDLRDVAQLTQPAQTIFAWGGQAEANVTATSYITTVAASASRSADTANWILSPASAIAFYSMSVTATPQARWDIGTARSMLVRGSVGIGRSSYLQVNSGAFRLGQTDTGGTERFWTANSTLSSDFATHHFTGSMALPATLNVLSVDGAPVANTFAGGSTVTTSQGSLSLGSIGTGGGWLKDICYDSTPYGCK